MDFLFRLFLGNIEKKIGEPDEGKIQKSCCSNLLSDRFKNLKMREHDNLTFSINKWSVTMVCQGTIASIFIASNDS